MVLTNRQRKALHGAMLEYLTSQGEAFQDTAAAFRREAELEDAPAPSKLRKNLLEKKWTAVVRLQKKVMDLEAKVKQLSEDLKSCAAGGGRKITTRPDAVPRAPAKHALTGHRYPVTCVAFHPVYTQLASASEDATIKLWDFESGQFEKSLKGHTNAVQWLSFNATGSLLASAAADMSVKLWDMNEGGSCIRTLRGHEHNVTGVAFLPSGDKLVSCSRDCTIKLWEVGSGYCVKTISGGHKEWVRRVAVNHDGSLIASCSNDQTVAVWNATSYEKVASHHEHAHVVECVAFCGKAGAATLAKEYRKAQAVTNAKAQAQASSGAGVGAGAGSGVAGSTRQFLASCSRDKTVIVWDVTNETVLAKFTEHGSWVRAVCWHPNGKFVLSVSEDRSMRVWEVATGGCVRKVMDAHQHFVTALAVHEKQLIVATGGVDNLVSVWECR